MVPIAVDHHCPILPFKASYCFSEWPTFPQCYIKGEFIGGSDILLEMYESGELQEMVKDLQKA